MTVLIMVSYYLNWIFMESMARILHFINLIWITGILEQQYIMTVITAIKFQAGPKLEMESYKAPRLDLDFFFYIKNDLSKIINETSAPITFADDTSILFTNLSWNNYMDLFTKNCSSVCYIIINVKTYVCLSTKNNLSCFFLLGHELRNNILRKPVA
jgi:hypothetical protein